MFLPTLEIPAIEDSIPQTSASKGLTQSTMKPRALATPILHPKTPEFSCHVTDDERQPMTSLLFSNINPVSSREKEFPQGNESQEDIPMKILQQNLQGGGIRWKNRFPQKLSSEGEEKRKIRRERNRLAASKCRERRREKTYDLVQESEELENDNASLTQEIQDLELQKQQMEEWLRTHVQNGECLKHMEDIHIDP